MLDELTPQQFDEWLAFAKLEPFGELKRAERDADLLATVASFGAESAVDSLEVLEAWQYDTGREEGDDVLTAEQTFAAICGAFGVM